MTDFYDENGEKVKGDSYSDANYAGSGSESTSGFSRVGSGSGFFSMVESVNGIFSKFVSESVFFSRRLDPDLVILEGRIRNWFFSKVGSVSVGFSRRPYPGPFFFPMVGY